MKKSLAAILCLALLASVWSLFSVPAAAAGPMVVWNFDTANSARALVGDDLLLTGAAVTRFQVGDGGGEGIVTFDAEEKALCLTPDFTKPGSKELYYQRVTISLTEDTAGFAGKDYPYIKVKFKLVSKNDLTTLRIRSFDWKTWDIYSVPELGKWIECTYDLTGTSFEDQVFNSKKGLYFQLQSMDTGYNTYSDTDYKLYIQYIAFFQNKEDCRAYTYTPTQSGVLSAEGRIALMPFHAPRFAKGLSAMDSIPPAESQFNLVQCEFGRDQNGYAGYDEKEQALYISSAAKLEGKTTHCRFNIIGSGDASVLGANYPYLQFAYKTENYTPSSGAYIRLRDQAWNSINLVAPGGVKAGEWTVVSVKLEDLYGGHLWKNMKFDAANFLRIQLDDQGTNPTAEDGARIYLKYIAFFERKSDMQAFDFEKFITGKPAATTAPATTAAPSTTAVPETTAEPETTDAAETTAAPAVSAGPAAAEGAESTLSPVELTVVAVMIVLACGAALLARKRPKG